MDLNTVSESLRRGIGEIPPIAIALVLLAGPTAALIGYRLIGAARRMQTSPEVVAAPLWVCAGCRSVNELRVSRCYRCGAERDSEAEVELVVDQPAPRPGPVNVPAGSPFAAAVTGDRRPAGVPVMADRVTESVPVAVGPGRDAGAVPSAPADAPVDLVEANR